MQKTASQIRRVSEVDAYIDLGNGIEAAIDAEDASLVEKLRWHAVRSGKRVYVACSFKNRNRRWQKIYLHRLLLVTPSGLDVDHIDGDGLNCRMGNLRAATRSENLRNARRGSRNTSGFKGVSKLKGRWYSSIKTQGRRRYLGSFDKPEDAHEAYMKAAREHYGEFFNPG